MRKKMTDRQRELLALAHILDLDDCDPRNFRDYRIAGRKWMGVEGAPEWSCNLDSEWWQWDAEYITVFDFSGGFRNAPESARGKRLVYSYVASERGCPWCGPGTGNEDSRPDCDLCEADGYIYQGEIGCYVYQLAGR